MIIKQQFAKKQHENNLLSVSHHASSLWRNTSATELLQGKVRSENMLYSYYSRTPPNSFCHTGQATVGCESFHTLRIFHVISVRDTFCWGTTKKLCNVWYSDAGDCDVTPSNLVEIYLRFRETWCLHIYLRTAKKGSSTFLPSIPKFLSNATASRLKKVIFQDNKYYFFDPKHYVPDITVMCTQYSLHSCI